MRHRGQAVFAERQLLHGDVGRVLEDALLVQAGARAVLQRGRVLVRLIGELVEFATGQFTQLPQVRLQVLEQVGLQIQTQQRLELRVVQVGVGAGAVRNRDED